MHVYAGIYLHEVGGVGRFCRDRESAVVERQAAVDAAARTVAETGDPQTLAQNIIAHKRNFKGLVDLFEKVGAVFQRMQCLDKNIHKNLYDMMASDDVDHQNMGKMKEMVLETLSEVR
jgi:ABC-type phosphate transport system ATPase subunit